MFDVLSSVCVARSLINRNTTVGVCLVLTGETEWKSYFYTCVRFCVVLDILDLQILFVGSSRTSSN